MLRNIDLRVALKEASEPDILEKKVSRLLGTSISDLEIKVLRKSVDARKKDIYFNYKLAVYIGEPVIQETITFPYQDVSRGRAIHIIGFGPAGMWAALRCLELGFKPVVLERGKKVRERRRDLRAINQDHHVNPDSNYCFGEGGAGTYSDGKLYTRSLKRGDVRSVFERFVYHGATPGILAESHPHIGTNKLPQIVENIRETILRFGGEIHFEQRVTEFILNGRILKAIQLSSGQEMTVERVILAPGHSARDIIELLHRNKMALQPKSFAMGVRVEHPQYIIDGIQYHCKDERHPLLPAASYSLVEQVRERGVYSFCMCPGGFIVPSATAAGEVVVNGMSPSKRNNSFANSGMVVAIDVDRDLNAYSDFGALRGLEFQKNLEKLAFQAGGRTQAAPAQRLTDFVEGSLSETLNPTSYQPGLTSAPLHSLLPKVIGSRLRDGFKIFDAKMKGYLTHEANVVGVESRTSSTVTIPRNHALEHPEIAGLFPCGEGAGYAGGIVSAAMDGERCANAAIGSLRAIAV